MEQRSDEWFEARLGKATASHFKDIMAVGKNGAPLAGRKNYRAQLVIERTTGKRPERFSTPAMDWGTETEDLARLTYSLETGNEVQSVGFIESTIMKAGASPDGLVGEDGTIEIKCLNTANHIEVLKGQQVPADYFAQIQGQLWIAKRQWCDFISFDPDMPENAQIFIKRVERDEAYINDLKVAVSMFLDEVDADEEFLKNYKQGSL